MKIESSSNEPRAALQNAAGQASHKIDAAVQPNGTADAGSATVNLSSMTTVRAANAADIDMDKVASIKAAIRDGSYTIDPSRIADGMLDAAREMLQTRTR